MNRPDPARGMFLPDFCNARTVFVVILLAELLAIILILAEPPYTADALVDFALHSLFIQWVALSCTGLLCVSRNVLQQYTDHWVATISYGVTLIVTCIVAELAWLVLDPGDGMVYQGTGHAVFIIRAMGISAIVWALALRYFYVQNQWRRRVISESEARFQALQSRIKPHFLFNCMNTIAGLIRRTPNLAEEAIEDLADLFRASLADTRKTCTLADEIALCKRYLRIEQHRLGRRLTVSWRLDEVPLEVQLPVLSIQPLLENAIYHGIETLPEGGSILISGIRTGDGVRIVISNPLPGGDTAPSRDGNRIAQENVAQRLASCFGREGLLEVSRDRDNYQVIITLPDDHEDTDR